VTFQFRIIFSLIAVVWVGGLGFLFFRYPEFFARVNVRFGFKSAMNPKFLRFIRQMGIVEMILAALSLISTVVMAILGWK
jgi:hypothetical protein